MNKTLEAESIASTDLLELYEGEDYTGRYHDAAGERILRLLDHINLSKNDTVLDVGCGNGLLLPEIIGKIKHYDGVDFSKAFIKEAEDRASKIKLPSESYYYHAGDVVDYCKNKTGYNKVFALDFTEHINDKELINIFSSVKNSMHKNGQVVIHTPNKDFILERIKSDEVKINKQGHIGLRNAQEYQRLFEEMGYTNVKVVPLSHYISILKPLHILSYIPIKKFSSLFQARLLVICEA